MYAKVYEAIFDSSLAEDYQVRHVFEDLLKLADQDGVVNRTPEAIARRTNVPLEIVQRAITELLKPDHRSQSKAHEGRRIIPLQADRDWGWQIVNHGYYRKLRTAEEKRQSDRERQKSVRARQPLTEKKATDCDTKLQSVTSAYASASVSEGSAEGNRKAKEIETLSLEACRCYSQSVHTPTAGVVRNVAELFNVGHTAEEMRKVFKWVVAGDRKFKAHNAMTLTDPDKFGGWLQKSAGEQPRRRTPNI